jgi:hypothetical protein
MAASTKLFDLLRDLLEQLPSLLTLLVCMVVAIARWKKHPRVSLVVLISLGFLFFHLLVFTVVYNWVPDWLIHAAPIANQASVTRNVYLVLALVTNTSLAVGLALLLTGIFMKRTPAS